MKTKKCTKCKQATQLSSKYFHRETRSKDGFTARCKKCANTHDAWRRKIGTKRQPLRTIKNKARSVQYLLEHRERRRQQISALKLHLGCCVCDYRTCLRGLHFHHADDDTKAENISLMRNGESSERIMNELLKCVVMCANCHAELHDGLIAVKKSQTIKKSTITKFLKNNLPYECT